MDTRNVKRILSHSNESKVTSPKKWLMDKGETNNCPVVPKNDIFDVVSLLFCSMVNNVQKYNKTVESMEKNKGADNTERTIMKKI